MPKPKRYYHVITPDGQERAGSELFDNALKSAADEYEGMILDPEGFVVYVSPVLSAEQAEQAESADPATAPEAAASSEKAS